MAEGQVDPAVPATAVAPLNGTDHPLPGRCGSPLANKPGRFCGRYPIRGKTRCQKHGGKSLSGIASATFKHGRYSKAIRPMRDLSRYYRDNRADPDYLHCLDEIALNQARIAQLGERLPTGEAGKAWKTMVRLIDALVDRLDEFDGAMAKRNTEAAGAAIRSLRPLAGQMREATGEGMNESAIWGEINGQLFLHTKLVGAETKRRQVDEQSMPADVVFTMVGSIVSAFAEVVADRELRRQFSDRVQALIGPSSAPIDTQAVVEATQW